MAAYDEDDYDEFDEESSLPKKLRAKIKELSDQVKELSSENSSLKNENRSRVLKDTLASKGLNPKIAAFVPADISADDVDAWLEEYGEVFGGAAADSTQQETGQQTVVANNAAHAASLSRMNAVEQAARQPSPQDIMAQIDNAESMDDLMALLRNNY